MYVYAISNNCNYEITVSNGYAKKESAFLDMIAEMNTALHDMVGNEQFHHGPARTSLWTTSPLRKASPAARCLTGGGFSLNYGDDCCYGKVAEIAGT